MLYRKSYSLWDVVLLCCTRFAVWVLKTRPKEYVGRKRKVSRRRSKAQTRTSEPERAIPGRIGLVPFVLYIVWLIKPLCICCTVSSVPYRVTISSFGMLPWYADQQDRHLRVGWHPRIHLERRARRHAIWAAILDMRDNVGLGAHHLVTLLTLQQQWP